MLQNNSKIDLFFPQNLPVIDNDFDNDSDENYYMEAGVNNAQIKASYEQELDFN